MTKKDVQTGWCVYQHPKLSTPSTLFVPVKIEG